MIALEVGPVETGRGDAASSAHPQRFMARQPILNRRMDVLGYELLFRSGWENVFRGDVDQSTRSMLDNCLYMGIESLTNHGTAFVNCTREALVSRVVTLLPAKSTVLEVLETVEPDAEVVQACRELRGMGYRLALDDFVPRDDMRPLIELASYIKVDFRLSDARERREVHDLVRGSGAVLLAEKIEDQSEFDIACAEGYDYFQGYFFCRPKIVANREISPNRMNYLRLLVEMTRKPLCISRVTDIVRVETSFCYRLLRLANSALWGRQREVTSVQEAFMVVGEDRFRMLVSVAASCVLSKKQPALISLSLERARFCELLAPMVGENPTEQFMLGLLSLVDAMLQIPMEKVANSLPLRAEARAALLGAINSAAMPLCMIRGFEAGSWEACAGEAEALGVSEAMLSELYLEAVKWTGELVASAGS